MKTITIVKPFSLIIIFLFVILIVGCSSDDDNDNSFQNDQTTLYKKKIEGTWKLISRRTRDKSNEFLEVENYEKTISFSNDNNVETYKVIVKDYSILKDPEKATTSTYEGTYSIKKNGDRYILYRCRPHLGVYLESWDYIEFDNDYGTLTLLESRPSGYLDIDEKYKRANP